MDNLVKKSGNLKDSVYLLERGHILTSSRIETKLQSRRTVSILLSVHQQTSFKVQINDEEPKQQQAIAIKPFLKRAIHAMDVPTASFLITPLHPSFRRFRAIPTPGYLLFERKQFAPFDDALTAAYLGELNMNEASELFEGVMRTVEPRLPVLKPIDSRIERIVALLQEDTSHTLNELAAQAGVSRWRMTHLFAQEVGLPLRSYKYWQKTYKAHFRLGTRQTLTEIARAEGFTDLPHLSRMFRQLYGMPLSRLLDGNQVQVFYRNRRSGETAILNAPLPGRRRKSAVPDG